MTQRPKPTNKTALVIDEALLERVLDTFIFILDEFDRLRAERQRVASSRPLTNNSGGKAQSEQERTAYQKREVEVKTVSVSEAARIAGIGKNLAYELIRADRFPHKRIRGRVVVPLARLYAWIESDEEVE